MPPGGGWFLGIRPFLCGLRIPPPPFEAGKQKSSGGPGRFWALPSSVPQSYPEMNGMKRVGAVLQGVANLTGRSRAGQPGHKVPVSGASQLQCWSGARVHMGEGLYVSNVGSCTRANRHMGISMVTLAVY